MTEVVAPIYDSYASIYDAIGQGRFSEGMAAWTLRWLAGRTTRIEHVLDLACGTGAATLVFAAAGCRVAGVDRSAAMLGIARGRARDAGYAVAFVEGDIRDITTNDQRPTTKGQRQGDKETGRQGDRRSRIEDRRSSCRVRRSSFVVRRSSFVVRRSSFVVRRSSFDLATCFYDSLNYLTAEGDLDRVFGGVAAALRRDGHLVFDLNTAAEYATWDERAVVTYDGRDCLVYNMLSYDPEARLATGRIVWFVRETELWWRGEETHVERAWSDAEVRRALAGAGLALVARLNVEGQEIAEGAQDVGRVVYVARRD